MKRKIEIVLSPRPICSVFLNAIWQPRFFQAALNSMTYGFSCKTSLYNTQMTRFDDSFESWSFRYESWLAENDNCWCFQHKSMISNLWLCKQRFDCEKMPQKAVGKFHFCLVTSFGRSMNWDGLEWEFFPFFHSNLAVEDNDDEEWVKAFIMTILRCHTKDGFAWFWVKQWSGRRDNWPASHFRVDEDVSQLAIGHQHWTWTKPNRV
jgi:hypothetical protein